MDTDELTTQDMEILVRIAEMGKESFGEESQPPLKEFQFEKTYLPEKNLHLASQYNNFDTILDPEDQKRNGEECPNENCHNKQSLIFPNCYICQREAVIVACDKCYQHIVTACSEKCQKIMNGAIDLIEFESQDDQGNNKVFLIIEDHKSAGLILKVIDHSILDKELGLKERSKIGTECIECLKDYVFKNLEDYDYDDEELNNDDVSQETLIKNFDKFFEENIDHILKKIKEQELQVSRIGLLPLKCNQCWKNYSFEVGCIICNQKDLYFCQECIPKHFL